MSKFKFSVGPWNVHTGADSYGPETRKMIDLESKFAKFAELGFSAVQFHDDDAVPDMNNMTDAEIKEYARGVKKLLDKYGLKVSGTHTGWQEVAEHFEETVAYHKTIGNHNIIVPGCDLSDQKKLDDFVEMANKFQPMLEKEGISFGYHNHAHEFKPNVDGSMIHDQLVYRTNLNIEIDTYWAYVGMGHPIELMERLKDRLKVIHIKDGYANGEGMPLGQGTAPVAEVYKKAVELGIPMVVESETLKPSGMEEARICIEFLKAQEK